MSYKTQDEPAENGPLRGGWVTEHPIDSTGIIRANMGRGYPVREGGSVGRSSGGSSSVLQGRGEAHQSSPLIPFVSASTAPNPHGHTHADSRT